MLSGGAGHQRMGPVSPHGCERPRRSQPHRRESRAGTQPGQGLGRLCFPGTELHPGRQDAAAGDGGDGRGWTSATHGWGAGGCEV